jgi:hypothetical protein
MSVNCSNIKLNHYALKVHRLRRGLKSRLFLIINLLKCHVVKWISAECFATESLAPKVHSFGLTLWDSKLHESALNIPDIDKDFLNRLTMEAGLLSEMGFDVVYEPLDAGYGLALTISKDLTVAFLIPLSYPNQAPLVFIKTASNIEQIDFAPDTWQADHTIAEVVSALTD